MLEISNNAQILVNKIDTLVVSVKEKLITIEVMDIAVQKELAKLMAILCETRVIFYERMDEKNIVGEVAAIVDSVEIAINGLFEKANVFFSKRLRYCIYEQVERLKIEKVIENEQFLSRHLILFFNYVSNHIRRIRQSTKVPTMVFVGLILSYFANIGIVWGISSRLNIDHTACINLSVQRVDSTDPPDAQIQATYFGECSPYEESISLILWVWLVGATGGTIGVLSRLKDFEDDMYQDDMLPYLLGAVRPVIGATFGFFILALANSPFLPIEQKKGSEWFTYAAFAFVAGFSERLVRDFITQTENRFSTYAPQGLPLNSPIELPDSRPMRVIEPMTLAELPDLKITVADELLFYGETTQLEVAPAELVSWSSQNNIGTFSLLEGETTKYTAPLEKSQVGKVLITAVSKTDPNRRSQTELILIAPEDQ